jgi:hypothetical protein
MSLNYSPRIVTDGLVLYLDAANTKSYFGSGASWNDLSRSRINSDLINGPTFNNDNGGRNLKGTIYTTKIYNRDLSSDEVYKNFISNKSRFGL